MTTFIDEAGLAKAEELAVQGDSTLHQWLAKCVSEVRRLQHELADPNYWYSGRIHRQAILCRNAKIDSLLEEIKTIKAARKA